MAKLGTVKRPITKAYKRTTLDSCIQLYNQIPTQMKNLNPKDFKTKLKKMSTNYIPS